MRYILLLTVYFLIFYPNSSILFAEDEQVTKLPPKIEKIIQSAKINIIKEYQSEIAKLLKELDKSKILATKAGNLKDANMLDSLIKEVSADSLLAEIIKDNKGISKGNVLGNPSEDAKNNMVGKWKFNINGSPLLDITFDGKKGVSSNTQSFTYTLKNGNLEITWVGGGIWSLKLDAATKKFIGKDSDGSNVTAEPNN